MTDQHIYPISQAFPQIKEALNKLFILDNEVRITNYIKNVANVTQASLAAQVLIGIKQDGALLDNSLFSQIIAGTPYEKLFVDVVNDAIYEVSCKRRVA